MRVDIHGGCAMAGEAVFGGLGIEQSALLSMLNGKLEVVAVLLDAADNRVLHRGTGVLAASS